MTFLIPANVVTPSDDRTVPVVPVHVCVLATPAQRNLESLMLSTGAISYMWSMLKLAQ